MEQDVLGAAASGEFIINIINCFWLLIYQIIKTDSVNECEPLLLFIYK